MDDLTINIASRIGGRVENQDSFGCCQTGHGYLVVVCDGMGGVKGGATASKLAVDTILDKVSGSKLTRAGEILEEAITKANSLVFQAGRTHPDLQGMGTTVVALLIDENKATAAHVGDSRIYQVRGSKRIFRTFDHSMVFELVKRGVISEEQARVSPESNVILRALGTRPEVEVEINEDIPYRKGDRFLLCSDGIWGAVSEKELLKLVRSGSPVEETVENLAETIDNLGIKKGGGHDNLTAALIETNTDSKMKSQIQMQIRINSKALVWVLAVLLLISLILNIFFNL
jgi:serine/threonine protein phosphatase PrpC